MTPNTRSAETAGTPFTVRTRRLSAGATLALACTLAAAALPGRASGCTWFEFRNDLGKPFIGRSMEWPTDLQGEITVVPRNHAFKEFKARYGFVGMSHDGYFSDGLNEHGLACSALWLDESKYSEKAEGAFDIGLVEAYVLGNTRTVDEAVAFFRARRFYAEKKAALKGIAPAFHFAITEASGRSVVVEFIEGETRIHENKVGAMTNDPRYELQLQNWAKYEGKKFDEETFDAFDFSPQGKFCRMAAMNATQARVPTDVTAVNRAWSMLNTVDLPMGVLYWRQISDHPQFTSYSLVADLQNRVYYFRTYDNYDIRKIDLRKIDFARAKYRSASVFGAASYREFTFPAR